ERNGEGDAEQKQHERRERARDQADSEVARDVAADLAVDAVADRAPARLRLRRQEAVEAFHPGRSLEEHEEREECDRHGTDDEAEDALRHRDRGAGQSEQLLRPLDRKSTRLNSSHVAISYAVFCLKKKK